MVFDIILMYMLKSFFFLHFIIYFTFKLSPVNAHKFPIFPYSGLLNPICWWNDVLCNAVHIQISFVALHSPINFSYFCARLHNPYLFHFTCFFPGPVSFITSCSYHFFLWCSIPLLFNIAMMVASVWHFKYILLNDVHFY